MRFAQEAPPRRGIGIPARALADARARGLFRVGSPAIRADDFPFYLSNAACGVSADGARLVYGKGDTDMTKTSDQQTKALAALYTVLAAQDGKRTVRELSAEDRTAYNREAQRKHREKKAAARTAGRPEATDDAIRVALSDAAILLLAVGGPGADAIERAVHTAFPGRPGVASSTRMRARAGTLPPRMLTPERLSMPKA